MAHELSFTNGKAEMFYVGDPPWHRLGTGVERALTAAEAIRAASLDWKVEKVPLFIREGSHDRRVLGSFATARTDRRKSPEDFDPMGIVGREYEPLQNEEAFGFMDSLVKTGGVKFHTAGALDGGRRVWMLAKLPGELRVLNTDVLEKYLLLSNSHDGTSSVQIKFTPIRVVCQNTLTLALRGGAHRVSHRSKLWDGLERIRDLLGLADHAFTQLKVTTEALTHHQVDSKALGIYLDRVYPLPPPPPPPLEGRSPSPGYSPVLERAQFARIVVPILFEQGRGAEFQGARGTAWGAYNAVTEFVDHVRRRPGPRSKRTPDELEDRHLQSLWFEEGSKEKARALTEAENLIKAGVFKAKRINVSIRPG